MPPQSKKILLLGADFATGNLGVSALAWSSLYGLINSDPNVSVALWASGRTRDSVVLTIDKKTIEIKVWPVRWKANPFVQDHLLYIALGVLAVKLFARLADRLKKKENSLGALLSADLICDITGGDSFSDIYGIQRLFRNFLIKSLCLLIKKPFILLPQTYGPFQRWISRWFARYVLRRSTAIYARDQKSITLVENLLSRVGENIPLQLCPDVAFLLEPTRPSVDVVERVEQIKKDNKRIVGLNISGLLYHGGYTLDNMFGLKCDYKQLCRQIVEYFTTHDAFVFLIPHVLTREIPIEDDLQACKKICAQLPDAVRKKTIILDRGYNQNEIKYLIGLCDFFIGARMHATIAALSQCVPAVGLAYSDKFRGVFETVGVQNCVFDMRSFDGAQILAEIIKVFENRQIFSSQLKTKMPMVKKRIEETFKAITDILTIDDKAN